MTGPDFSGKNLFGPNWAKRAQKGPKMDLFDLFFKILSLVLAENVLKCAPYCRKSDDTIPMSRKNLVLVFLGSKLSTNQIAGFFKWSLLENRLIFLFFKFCMKLEVHKGE